MNIIISNLSKSFEGRKVLDNICLTLIYGENYCITGNSGCGKTTLLNILMGIIKVDHGEISGIADKTIAVVFQEDRLCENLSVGRNIKMVCQKEVKKDDIKILLSQLGLKDLYHTPIKKLSGGMKRRVAIARALIAKSDILIMDEPFKGLDDTSKSLVIDIVKERSLNKTIIWVTHDTSELLKLGGNLLHI